DVPQVVIYRTSKLNYAIGSRVVKVDYISLVNLIVDKEIIKELIQDEVTTDSIIKELKNILEDETHRDHINTGYKQLRKILIGENASKNTAKEIYEILSVLRTEFS
ncbi:MAG: lipid-A-disaccharide synthase, partial [Cyclobacteriaceae bacterium]|nr:lipid-A-disaccharide synthase [Cyclobacteriaceae bacterium]